MIGGAAVVVLGLAQVRPVVRLAETGDLEGGAGDLGPLREGVVDLGPLDVPGPEGQQAGQSGSLRCFMIFSLANTDVEKNIKKTTLKFWCFSACVGLEGP